MLPAGMKVPTDGIGGLVCEMWVVSAEMKVLSDEMTAESVEMKAPTAETPIRA